MKDASDVHKLLETGISSSRKEAVNLDELKHKINLLAVKICKLHKLTLEESRFCKNPRGCRFPASF